MGGSVLAHRVKNRAALWVKQFALYETPRCLMCSTLQGGLEFSWWWCLLLTATGHSDVIKKMKAAFPNGKLRCMER